MRFSCGFAVDPDISPFRNPAEIQNDPSLSDFFRSKVEGAAIVADLSAGGIVTRGQIPAGRNCNILPVCGGDFRSEKFLLNSLVIGISGTPFDKGNGPEFPFSVETPGFPLRSGRFMNPSCGKRCCRERYGTGEGTFLRDGEFGSVRKERNR